MSVGEPAGVIALPELPEPLDGIWDTILDLAQRLQAGRWALVGGQMVVLHGLMHRRRPVRITRDVDVLANLIVSRSGIRDCVRAVTALGFSPHDATERDILHRFVRADDHGVVDVLAPDHSPPRWPLTTVPPRRTIQIEGGRQALDRAVVYEVTKDQRTALVSVPYLLGALVLKAAAYVSDSRDRDRHAYDAAFLSGLIEDPRAVRGTFKGSDRKRLLALDRVIGDRDHPAWQALGEAADDSHITWRLLVAD